jgi:peptidoglycan-associated lipoprotein
MKRKSFLVLMAMFLMLPIVAVGLTSCIEQVKDEGMSEEELARLRAEQERARLEAEAKDRFLNEHAQFDFDKYNIRPDAAEVLRFKAEYMSGRPGVGVEVQGHCDERGSLQYNIALGDRRAHAAANFVESLGVDPSRMTPVTYGEERPLDPGQNEEAWALNRRAQFVIVSE